MYLSSVKHVHAGLCTVVYLSRAFNPPPHPTDEFEAARNGNHNAKVGLAAAALSYLCKARACVLNAAPVQHPAIILSGLACCACTPEHLALLITCPLHINRIVVINKVHAGYSTAQGPSSPLVRPHPAVWKLIHGVLVLYLVSLIFLLFQDAHDARQLLKVKLCLSSYLNGRYQLCH